MIFLSVLTRISCSSHQTEKDILLREELKEVKKNHPDKLSLWFTLDKPPQGKEIFSSVLVFCLNQDIDKPEMMVEIRPHACSDYIRILTYSSKSKLQLRIHCSRCTLIKNHLWLKEIGKSHCKKKSLNGSQLIT